MEMTRRELLAAAGALPFAGAALGQDGSAAKPEPSPRTLPDKAAFAATDLAYLDSGSQHPISLGGKAAVEAYLAMRTLDPAARRYELDQRVAIARFAKLVNADPDELTFVQSTTAGEQMVVRALGIPESGGHIVTDTLHFFGSIPLYEELARQGMEVSWIAARDGRIELDDVRRAVRPGTKLVALSLVSTINGFEQDLKAVCDIAHAAGAYVFADIIHAAGCVPLDLHASGVDFAATASYKWLMGDFGIGFLYVRKDVQPKLKRSNYGYYGISEFTSHIYPLDPPGTSAADFAFSKDAQGLFGLGTRSHMGIALLNHSLDYIQALGVVNIQAHAQSLTSRLKEELPKLGYPLMTPPESRTPIVACVMPNASKVLGPKLQAAKVKITTSANRFRVTVSVFNDMADIDRLLAAIGKA
ncbi:MAG: aminotransferase class V-fold PLP-dependent enzyme [Steroidobacteraceae bacterium]|nr:aminotransferase class V-fold PLP-dependent enzyme [Steroidobacteraceae bacterium]